MPRVHCLHVLKFAVKSAMSPRQQRNCTAHALITWLRHIILACRRQRNWQDWQARSEDGSSLPRLTSNAQQVHASVLHCALIQRRCVGKVPCGEMYILLYISLARMVQVLATLDEFAVAQYDVQCAPCIVLTRACLVDVSEVIDRRHFRRRQRTMLHSPCGVGGTVASTMC